jgi:glycosyltransferase involved in cell wall biosynthesis
MSLATTRSLDSQVRDQLAAGYHPGSVHIAFMGTRGVPARYGGFETCVEQVGRRMAARGHRVTVFCRDQPAEPGVPYRGMHLVHIPAIPQKHLETLSRTALSSLRLPRDAALVMMGVGNAPIVRLLERAGRRLVFNVDGADWQRDKWGGFASRYLRACERMAARSDSILIADARTVQESYLERFGRESELVAYGADPPGDTGTAALERFDLESDCYMLWAGRLVPENGAHDYLQAVAAAQVGVPAVVLGDAPYQHDYIAKLRADAPAGAVFTGYQYGSSYQQLSAHAGLHVLAATVGGTHPVLIEQMAAGNCILARDGPTHREVLGDAGWYWSSPEELADLMRRLWADPDTRRATGERARLRVAELYSWERVTDRYLELCARSLGVEPTGATPEAG